MSQESLLSNSDELHSLLTYVTESRDRMEQRARLKDDLIRAELRGILDSALLSLKHMQVMLETLIRKVSHLIEQGVGEDAGIDSVTLKDETLARVKELEALVEANVFGIKPETEAPDG